LALIPFPSVDSLTHEAGRARPFAGGLPVSP
jgi:hypothetical protein